MQPLPIESCLAELLAKLESSRSVVLEAPPGAGKTTRVPWALCEAFESGQVIVTEPRRVAARLAATRVADERNLKLGEQVGYTVRFEDLSGPKTRLRYVTEGVLVRELLSGQGLRNAAAIVIDEVHERHLNTDLALALVKRAQATTHPELRLVVMSATLEAGPIARLLEDCPRITSAGKMFPVDIQHLGRPDERPLEKQIVSATRQVVREDHRGVLVFLPGSAEIRRAGEALQKLAQEFELEVMHLHGELPLSEQVRAISPSSKRKLVLSTNVAESSVTVDGVTAVVDSGLVRTAEHSPLRGLPRLRVMPTSRASAIQRAGRAGRIAPGKVLRLYTQGDFELRPERDTPEILRADLAELLLALRGHELATTDLDWLDAPPTPALNAAESVLQTLGALDNASRLTELGRQLLKLPVHPRLARIVSEARAQGQAYRGALLAALLSERDIRLDARGGPAAKMALAVAAGDSDLLEVLDWYEQAEAARFEHSTLRYLRLDNQALKAVTRTARRLDAASRSRARQPTRTSSDKKLDSDEMLLFAIFTGFVDRLARRRTPGKNELILASGAQARLAETSAVQTAELMVALDAEQRAQGMHRTTWVRLASAVRPEWLLDAYSEQLKDECELVWNTAAGRVDEINRLAFGSVVLDESRRAARASPAATELLVKAVLDHPARFPQLAELESLRVRASVVANAMPELDLRVPALDSEALRSLLRDVAADANSLAELEACSWDDAARAGLGPNAHLLDRYAPKSLALASGRRLTVHYDPSGDPWVEAWLQDFFGLRETPRICEGRLPLAVRLLAPNRRPVQITKDLAGFWERHYPALRRELMRRYPKHAWPEDGANAKPPPPRPRARRK